MNHFVLHSIKDKQKEWFRMCFVHNLFNDPNNECRGKIVVIAY